MSKVITSPVRKWPGKVTLADPLSFPQLIAWDDARSAAQEFTKPADESDKVLVSDGVRYARALLSGVLACVERWELAGFPEAVTVETFPSTPVRSSIRLLMALSDGIAETIAEDGEVPNA